MGTWVGYRADSAGLTTNDNNRCRGALRMRALCSSSRSRRCMVESHKEGWLGNWCN